jgi:transposase
MLAKAKVEVAVQIATRFIIAKLRNRQFFSLSALNGAIAEFVAKINHRVSRHLGASRRALFEEIERSNLKSLPAEPYVFAEWKQCRVGLDYHVEIDNKHYYSVPHQLLREKVWARITARTIEVFHRGKRVAAHVRSSSNRKHTTVREHMPSSHQRYADWTPERLRRQAGAIGRHTAALVEIILRERAHPEQGFRACVGIVRLAKSYGHERLEAACGRALEIGARSYSSVNSILKNDLDRQRPVVRVRLDRKATSISLLVVIGVREDGQKVVLAIKSMGGESTEAWRSVLDDLIKRGLRRPEFLIVDGAPGLDKAIAAVWDGVPVQRCTVHKHRNLFAHAPERLHDEITADYNDMIYAATRQEIEARRKAFIRKWRLKHRAVADSLEEAGDRLFTFTRLPPSQWRSARTTNAIERLHEEFKRRIKTQTVLPSADTAAMLFWALLASGQINMRKVDGWQTLSTKLIDQPIDLAA